MADTLIVTLGESAAGCLKQAAVGTHVVGVTDDLTEGRIPAADEPFAFERQRRAAILADRGPYEFDTFTAAWSHDWMRELRDARWEAVEVWADPDPAAQLRLLFALHCLARLSPSPRVISVVQATSRIGDMEPDQAARLQRVRRPLNDRQAVLAAAAWSALQADSPVRWHALLSQSLSPLPFMEACVRRLLDELPAVGSGLTRTEHQLLSAIAGGITRPYRAFASLDADVSAPRLLGYWDLGRTLDRLAAPAAPLILGLNEGPFTAAMHDDDPQRLDHYKASDLQLTKLGRAILDGREDYSRVARIDRWWAGTHLTPANLWRWDNARAALIAPGATPPTA